MRGEYLWGKLTVRANLQSGNVESMSDSRNICIGYPNVS